MSKHTEGPWFVPTPLYRTYYVEARIDGGMLQEVASCGPTADPTQQAANARLIAAAPDLLEALEASLALIDLAIPFEGDVTRKARAALAKAKGEQV